MREEMQWNQKEITRRTRRAAELTQVSDLPYIWVPRKPVPPPFVPPPGWQGLSDKWVPGEQRAKNPPGTAAGSKRQNENWKQPESGPQEAPEAYAHGHDQCSVFKNSSGGGPGSCAGWNGCDLYEVQFGGVRRVYDVEAPDWGADDDEEETVIMCSLCWRRFQQSNPDATATKLEDEDEGDMVAYHNTFIHFMKAREAKDTRRTSSMPPTVRTVRQEEEVAREVLEAMVDGVETKAIMVSNLEDLRKETAEVDA